MARRYQTPDDETEMVTALAKVALYGLVPWMILSALVAIPVTLLTSADFMESWLAVLLMSGLGGIVVAGILNNGGPR
jgi:hypothetical protein